jgi:hypothetical protein
MPCADSLVVHRGPLGADIVKLAAEGNTSGVQAPSARKVDGRRWPAVRAHLLRRKANRAGSADVPAGRRKVKPKTSWQTQSLAALIASAKGKSGHASTDVLRGGSSGSFSAWDDGGDEDVAPASLGSTARHDFVTAIDDDCDVTSDSGDSDVSAVESWPPRMARQKAVTIVEREPGRDSASGSPVTRPASRQVSLFRAQNMGAPAAVAPSTLTLSSALMRRGEAAAGNKPAPSTPRRWRPHLPGGNKRRREDVAVSLLTDNFLIFQAGTRAAAHA